MYDLAIIGGGPAGLCAAVYAKRAMLKTIVIEKALMSGGQVINTFEVDNYLGFPNINGFDLSLKFKEHAENLGVEFINSDVIDIKNNDINKEIILKNGDPIKTKTIIIASGSKHRKLNIKGEEEFASKGVSYCATCDGAFYKNKTAAVIGGGNTALEDAIFLSNGCKKVILIHRRNEFRGDKVLRDKVLSLDNIEILFDTGVIEIKGENKVNSIIIKNLKSNEEQTVQVDGVFAAIGMEPTSEIYKNIVETDEYGYIKADETGQTSAKGIFAAGDIRTKMLRQIITAASDGANCVYSVQKFLIKE